mmetsp:Transcript_4027/g.4595  ORF Transcript_4027/g.4595 Transcript_4027/m.4595 type:complete len:268 (+) Transcript_4027:382-1185(+)
MVFGQVSKSSVDRFVDVRISNESEEKPVDGKQPKHTAITHVKGGLPLPMSTDQVLDTMSVPDISKRVFKGVGLFIKSSNVLEDDHKGRTTKEMVQTQRINFLGLHIDFNYHILCKQDHNKGTMHFSLAKQGMMKTFEGDWTVSPITDKSTIKDLNSSLPLAAGKKKKEGTVSLTQPSPNWVYAEFRQKIEPDHPPPKAFNNFLCKVSNKVVNSVFDEMEKEGNRIAYGQPIHVDSSLDKVREKLASLTPLLVVGAGVYHLKRRGQKA